MGKITNKSLCKLVKEKWLKQNLDEYIGLVSKPKYICKNCGRAANRKKNLCDSVKI